MPTNHLKTTQVYGNWVMQAPDGTEMCRCGADRAEWYLKRNLAVKITDSPPTFRLKFEPNGRGNAGDEYYLAKKSNCCVVCGTTEKLTKHHVVPQFYRKHFPTNIKSRSSHDIVVVCVPCHIAYEYTAKDVVSLIAEETGIPLIISVKQADKNLIELIKIAQVLVKTERKIPAERRAELSAKIDAHLGRAHTQEDLANITSQAKSARSIAKSHGEAVIKKIVADNMLNEFCIRWRQHFVDVMSPKFLPAGWRVDRRVD